MTGDADYLLKVVLRDLKLSDIVNNVLMPTRAWHMCAHRSCSTAEGDAEAAAGDDAVARGAKSREIRHSRSVCWSICAARFSGASPMALQLRPNCEYCDKDLPPHAPEARICTFECTFCADCVATKLFDVCPNWARICAAADLAGDGNAARPLRGEAAAVGQARPPVLQS